MKTTSPEYRRVREEIATRLASLHEKWLTKHNFPTIDITDELKIALFYNEADRILSIKGIAILSDNQSLPEITLEVRAWDDHKHYPKSQQDMLKAGFKKVVE